MNDIFITTINIKKVRHIESFNSPLSETERKNLIILGKTGNGKTSLLIKINSFFESLFKSKFSFPLLNSNNKILNINFYFPIKFIQDDAFISFKITF